MRRYFIWIRYRGTTFSGWQVQPNAPTVQASIEEALQLLIRIEDLQVVGCGRTDAGVHAAYYVFHVDLPCVWDENLSRKLNRILGPDIVFTHFQEVSDSLHARFSARKRTYKYLIDLEMPTFLQDCAYGYPYNPEQLDFQRLQSAAVLLLDYEDFFPFCKSKSETEHYRCEMFASEWLMIRNRYLIYTVEANRFLRGMVRLIVGMCLRVGEGKISLSEVREALDHQKRLENPYSAPAKGLFLYRIDYDDPLITAPSNDEIFFPI